MEILASHWHSKWCWDSPSYQQSGFWFFSLSVSLCVILCHKLIIIRRHLYWTSPDLSFCEVHILIWIQTLHLRPTAKKYEQVLENKAVPWQWASNEIVLEIVAAMTSACLKVWGSQAQTKAKAGGSHPVLLELSKGRGPSPGAEIIGKADFPNAVTPLPAYESDRGEVTAEPPSAVRAEAREGCRGDCKGCEQQNDVSWVGAPSHPSKHQAPFWKTGTTLQDTPCK